MTSLTYRQNIDDVLERLRSLYERRAGDRIFASMAVPCRALAEFREKYNTVCCEYPDPDERAEFWDRLFCERTTIEDDSMPAAYLSEFDQGLYGGLLGGEVMFMCHPDTGWISSMVPPLLKDWSEFNDLRIDDSHMWWKRYLKQLKIFVKRGAGKWGISHFILIDALNFIFELVGATETYLSVEEYPEKVRQAVDFAFDLNLKVQRTFFEIVKPWHGGTFSNFAQWIPGEIVSESLDPFHMTSVDYFEQWGREPVERILSEFDGGVIHFHGNGRHLLKSASTIRGLKAILLLDDLRIPPAFDKLEELKSRTGDIPVSLFVGFEQFVEGLKQHTLPGGVLYQVTGVPDISTANKYMEKVRAYRA